MRNSDYFAQELGWIKNTTTREFAILFVDLFPPYFAEKPSSSTGKYHAAWSNAHGGLRAHTRAVAYVAKRLAPAYSLSDDETDGALVAALGHDAVKYGFTGGPHTSKAHEYESAYYFSKAVDKIMGSKERLPCYQDIYNSIAWHQGRWSATKGAPPFPEGFTRMNQTVHVADMMTAQSEVSFNFLQNNLIG